MLCGVHRLVALAAALGPARLAAWPVDWQSGAARGDEGAAVRVREKRVSRRHGEKIPRVFGLPGSIAGAGIAVGYSWRTGSGKTAFVAGFFPGTGLWFWRADEAQRSGMAIDLKMAVECIEGTATHARERFLLAAREIQRARSRR